MSSTYNLRSRKIKDEEEVKEKKVSPPEDKKSEKKPTEKKKVEKKPTEKKVVEKKGEDLSFIRMFFEDFPSDDEEDKDYDDRKEYLSTIKQMLEGIEEEEENPMEAFMRMMDEREEEENELDTAFIDDEDDDPEKTKLALMMLKEILSANEDPFQNIEMTPKQENLYNKLMKQIEKEEPTPQRILNSKMPNSEKKKMIKTLMSFSQMEEDSFEYWVFRDMLHDRLKEWETLEKEESKELKKMMKKVENKTSILHQIAQLKAPDAVKEGLITLYNTSDMDDGTHKTRMKATLKIPFDVVRPITLSDQPKHLLLRHVKQELDSHLYGLEEVKRELMIAFNIRLSNPNVSTAILLNGPPGCGKTMITHVLARALGLYFHKISLGNLDHAQVLTGGESIWKGSSMSSITQALIDAQCKNPIILLDEIDKGRGRRGDRSVENALLQILDPTQNHNFRDLNIPEVPIDLSSIWWIATSNSIEHLSRPLLSRLRLIEVPEYSTEDLKNIVTNYVLPSICKKCSVEVSRIELDDRVLSSVLTENKKNIDELGVRFLEGLFEKTIGNLLLDEALSEEKGEEKLVITKDAIYQKKKSAGEYNLMYM